MFVQFSPLAQTAPAERKGLMLYPTIFRGGGVPSPPMHSEMLREVRTPFKLLLQGLPMFLLLHGLPMFFSANELKV